MRVLGVTGGTGCGKSVVCRILKEQGGKIIDADKITRKLQEPGEVVYDEIRDFFGSEIILPEGGIDRKKLGAIVFSDISKRRALNDIVHSRVSQEIKRRDPSLSLSFPNTSSPRSGKHSFPCVSADGPL